MATMTTMTTVATTTLRQGARTAMESWTGGWVWVGVGGCVWVWVCVGE